MITEATPAPLDTLGRRLRDMRISVTDRCNFRCTYCMPREMFGEAFQFVERDELLTFEEITRVVSAASRLGVRRLRLTGGEPLLRRDLPRLVRMLREIPAIEEIAMTTNGVLLTGTAGELVDAGLDRVTVSLDALDPETFAATADTTIPIERVLAGLAAARDAGLHPIKLNAVVQRGRNESEILPLARYARDHGDTVRFIEYMDVGTTNRWKRDEVVPADEILEMIDAVFPVEPVPDGDPNAPATRYRYRDGAGEIGVIASVTRPFCATCVRARLSPVGELYTCLFAARGHDLRRLLRGGVDEQALVEALREIWQARGDRYSELRAEKPSGPGQEKVEMHYIGG
jgi:GTP 3',8-cyclase